MRIRNFLSDESGAVAVDWVVITAGITGMGLAVIATASGGLEDLSGEIRTTLGEQMEAVVALATAGLTATAIWNDPANSTNEFANIDELSFSTVVDFTTDAEGIIFEFGATGRGAVLYQHDGVLYLQAGRGNDFGEAADRGEASWQVADGTATIEGSMNANGGLALMVNGEVVSQSSFNAPSLAGSDAGSVAGSNSGVARNRGGFDRNDPGHPGVTEVTFFEGQTTGAELTPIN
jgi:Flp pilus assembly pilin Flp